MTRLDNTPRPNGGPGWHPDPLGSGSERYFDGENWSGQVRRPAMSSGSTAGGRSHPPGFLDRFREAPTWLKIAVPVVLVLVVIGAASGGEKSGNGHSKPRPPTPTTTTQQTTAASRQPAKEKQREVVKEETGKPSADQRVREALGDNVSSDMAVGDSEVRSVKVNGQLVDVTLSTPEGGFEGPSTDDTDGLASAALARVYGEGDWRGATYVEFRGGLVDSATGRPLPNAPTVSYRIERNAARQIDWSDEEALYNIDWSIYRGLCHPAIKGC